MFDEKRINVFISSTTIDLPDHRQAVIEALTNLYLQPIGMENWAVTGEDPILLCEQFVRKSEAFIGIYAYRYGWCPNNYGGKSITELEYDWAETVISNGKPIPRFCFVMEETHPITIEMVETDKKKEMEAFKKRIMDGHHVGFFNSVDNLKAKVIQALAKWSIEKQRADIQTDEPSPKRAGDSATKETKKQGYNKVIVNRVDSGTALVNLLVGSDASHIENDDLANDSEVDLVGNFLQNITDYVDLLDELGPYERTKAAFQLNQEIDELDLNGFLVYGCQKNEKHRYGIGNAGSVVKLQVLYVFVLRKSNPRTKRHKELESALGFDSQTYSGEYAPFLLYTKT